MGENTSHDSGVGDMAKYRARESLCAMFDVSFLPFSAYWSSAITSKWSSPARITRLSRARNSEKFTWPHIEWFSTRRNRTKQCNRLASRSFVCMTSRLSSRFSAPIISGERFAPKRTATLSARRNSRCISSLAERLSSPRRCSAPHRWRSSTGTTCRRRHTRHRAATGTTCRRQRTHPIRRDTTAGCPTRHRFPAAQTRTQYSWWTTLRRTRASFRLDSKWTVSADENSL